MQKSTFSGKEFTCVALYGVYLLVVIVSERDEEVGDGLVNLYTEERIQATCLNRSSVVRNLRDRDAYEPRACVFCGLPLPVVDVLIRESTLNAP